MKTLKLILAAVLMLIVLLLPPPVAAQDAVFNKIQVTGVPASMPTQSYSNNLSSQPIVLEKDRPIGFWLFLAGTNSGAVSNVVATYQLGFDQVGTNFATTPVLTQTVVPIGTNQVVNLAQFNTNQLQGARTIRLYSLQNTNTQTLQIGGIVAGQFRDTVK